MKSSVRFSVRLNNLLNAHPTLSYTHPMQEQIEKRISDLVKAISALQPDLEKKAQVFRQGPGFHTNFDKWSDMHWCTNTFGNALVRLRLLVENNFRYIETMVSLASLDMFLNCSVWLRLLKSDTRFGMVYYRELLDTQLRYFKDTAAHYRREIDLLKDFDRTETAAVNTAAAIHRKEPSRLGASVGRAMDESML